MQIKCKKTISGKYLEHYRVEDLKDNEIEHNIFYCENCPYLNKNTECKDCMGQCLISIKNIIKKIDNKKNNEIKILEIEKKEIIRNKFIIKKNKKGEIIDLKEDKKCTEFLNTISSKYQIPLTTNIKIDGYRAYTWADNWLHCCEICKSKAKKENKKTQCELGLVCTKQKQKLHYI